MALTIYHNPRCSKSRQTLQLITESGAEHRVILYLEEPPSAATIESFAKRLGVDVQDLVRRGESTFKEAADLPALDDNAALAAWLQRNPIVLERPIIIDDERDKAVIGRPPENVNELLPQ